MSKQSNKPFSADKTRILFAQPSWGQEEINAVVKSLKSGWLGTGKLSEEFEARVAKLFAKKYGLFVNSGSSANLIAVEILNLPLGSEVIVQSCTFPTTLTPIVMKGLVPVFIDAKLGTYNIDISKIEGAISSKTKAIFISHVLGNVNDMQKLGQICRKYKLTFIEDSCDTLGSKFDKKPTGTWSDITTTSFYAPHHITSAGAGGMVMFNKKELLKEAKSLRDWGSAFNDNSDQNLKKRFNFKVGKGMYDGKFTYVKMGYNFKPIELQAAFGLVQLRKLHRFNLKRQANFKKLYNFFRKYEDFFILPQVHPKAEVYWLGFPLTISKSAPFDRLSLVSYLEKHQIQTRPVLAGNILRHEAFAKIKHRVYGSLENSDLILNNAFIVGCHPALTSQMIDYMCLTFDRFLTNYRKSSAKNE